MKAKRLAKRKASLRAKRKANRKGKRSLLSGPVFVVVVIGLCGRCGPGGRCRCLWSLLAWKVSLEGQLGRPVWKAGLEGRPGRLAWKAGLEGRLGWPSWKAGLEGQLPGVIKQRRFAMSAPWGPMGPMGPMGPLGPMGPMGPCLLYTSDAADE